jgi:hypothetical protein
MTPMDTVTLSVAKGLALRSSSSFFPPVASIAPSPTPTIVGSGGCYQERLPTQDENKLDDLMICISLRRGSSSLIPKEISSIVISDKERKVAGEDCARCQIQKSLGSTQ